MAAFKQLGTIKVRSAGRHAMDALLEKLDAKLKEWKPETAAEVRQRVAEMMAFADPDALDLMRSRAIEQEVLKMLDEPTAR
jgi:alpha-galactosidase/6-phospho-beta-glucosidase family protein